jgi:hypothetical protein
VEVGHTVVLNAPLFSAPLSVTWGEQVVRNGCWAIDMERVDVVGV